MIRRFLSSQTLVRSETDSFAFGKSRNVSSWIGLLKYIRKMIDLIFYDKIHVIVETDEYYTLFNQMKIIFQQEPLIISNLRSGHQHNSQFFTNWIMITSVYSIKYAYERMRRSEKSINIKIKSTSLLNTLKERKARSILTNK